jgi:rare lipoprotein A
MSLAILAGCSTPKKTGTKGSVTTTRGGGYYLDDGPGSNIPPGLENIPDAVPQIETHSASNFRPYVVFGKKYFPVSDEKSFRQQGTASWYGRKFHGKKTANGEVYDMYAMSAAHPTLPIPSYARVTHAKTGKSVVVRVNDRGPFHSKRIIDVSYVAASKLGLIGPGSGQVIVEAITNDDIRNGRAPSPKAKPIPAAPLPDTPPLQTVRAAAPIPDALEVLEKEGLSERAQVASADSPASATQTQALLHSSASREAGGTAAGVPVSAASGHIYLQFGAFSVEHTADGLAQKLNRQIAQVESRSAQVDNANNLYKVQIGPYPSRTAAVNAALRIQQATGMQPAVALR